MRAAAMWLFFLIVAHATGVYGASPPDHGADAFDDAGWKAVGRVQTELGTKCTGFLVAPSVVMTAAHCLWLPKTRRYVAPEHVHFLLGYDRGTFADHAVVTRFIIPQGYNPAQESTSPWADHATLALDHAVGGEVLPIVPVSLRVGMPVRLAGYRQDKVEKLTVEQNCLITGIAQAGDGHRLIQHNCPLEHGDSGAPLMAQQNGGRWVVVGINILATQGVSGGIAIPPE